VIEPENSDALVHAVCYLATNPELAREMGRNGREYIVRKFSRSQTAEKYIQVLEHMSKLPDRRKLAAQARSLGGPELWCFRVSNSDLQWQLAGNT